MQAVLIHILFQNTPRDRNPVVLDPEIEVVTSFKE